MNRVVIGSLLMSALFAGWMEAKQTTSTTDTKKSDTPASGDWILDRYSDPLHKIDYDVLTLNGIYVTPPQRTTGRTPILRIYCVTGKFSSAVLWPGTSVKYILNSRSYTGPPRETFVESSVDGDKTKGSILGVTEDGAFVDVPLKSFQRGGYGIGRLLSGNRVLVGVTEIFSGSVVMQFDIPDTKPLVEKCGTIR